MPPTYLFNAKSNRCEEIMTEGLPLGGLKNDEIKVCVGNKSIEDGILRERLSSSKKYDIKATPTIYINNEKYDGDLTFEALKLKIDSLLN